ncbi:TRAP transporter small permease [Bacillus norwichensis]|uniref:TRAP transporter small permease n=1 Tax=Bacillus norwichensis TaxID=2762217 RepID=A0ABR8VMJ5_9BACI|nr:TRAP transporter small permease [Bacillus norwichensis]MBD8005975.1 TRAP transporter small permease [Bacillus norwichensis]
MKLKKILNEKLEEWVLVASMVFLVILVVGQVFARYVMNFSIGWSEELARYLLIWIAWIAASYAVTQSAHIRVEIIKDRFSRRIKQMIELVVLIIWFGFAAFLAIEGTNFILQVQATNQVSPSLGVDMWIVYLAVPVGGVLMGIRLIQQAILIFKDPKQLENASPHDLNQ